MGESDIVGLQAAIYKSSNPTRRYLHQQRLAWVRAAIDESGARPGLMAGVALEIGPGSGIYVPSLLASHREVTVTDVEARHLTQVRAEFGSAHNLDIVADDIVHSSLPAGHFDTVLCSEVIEHIPATYPVLTAIHRLLKPGGRLILTTPQKYSSLELCCKVAFLPGVIDIVRRIYREPIIETGHINLMTKAQVTRALQDTGFETVRGAVMGLYVPVLAEFGGRFAADLAQKLERHLSGGPLEGVLWTQCVVVTKR